MEKMVRALYFAMHWLGNFKMSGSLVGRLTCAPATTRLTPQLVGISEIVNDQLHTALQPNPEPYIAKISFWKLPLINYCRLHWQGISSLCPAGQACFCWEIVVICAIIVLKLTVTVFSSPGVGNLTLAAAQKKLTRCGRSYWFSTNNSIPFMLLKLVNIWNFIQINLWFSQFTTVAQNMTHSIFIVQHYCDILCSLFESFWTSGDKLDSSNSPQGKKHNILQVVIRKLCSKLALAGFHWRKALFTHNVLPNILYHLFSMINHDGILFPFNLFFIKGKQWYTLGMKIYF